MMLNLIIIKQKTHICSERNMVEILWKIQIFHFFDPSEHRESYKLLYYLEILSFLKMHKMMKKT